MFIYELLGYVASVLVAVSLMMRSVFKLRVLNLFGSIAFTIYGLLIGAYPVAAVNFFIVLINIYYLREFLAPKKGEFFHVLEIQPGSEYLNYFLNFYKQDIEKFFPGFNYRPTENSLALFILRNNVPAGLFLAERLGNGAIEVCLDYVTPEYRDFKVGRYIYSDASGFFKRQGIRRIYSDNGNQEYRDYLQRMGFTPQSGQKGDTLELNLEK